LYSGHGVTLTSCPRCSARVYFSKGEVSFETWYEYRVKKLEEELAELKALRKGVD